MNENDEEVELEQEGPGVTVDEEGKEIQQESRGKVDSKSTETYLESQQDEDDEQSSQEEEDEDSTDEEREQIRAKRREDRAKRKQARKNAMHHKDRLVASLQMQVQDLTQRLAQIDNRQTGTDYAKLEEELNKAVRTATEAQQFIKTAVENGDGEGVADATELFYTARRQAEHLASVKQRMTRSATTQQVNQVDPRIANYATDWMQRNRWYKHGSSDTDSVVAKSIDDQLAREGYDARTKEYWEELDDRLSAKLPHRYAKRMKTSESTRQGSPNVGGSDKTVNSSPGAKKGFYLSEARVKAMKEAGAWDDPVARKKMIERYQQYDKENSSKDRR